MSLESTRALAKKLMESSLVSSELKETYIAILPFLAEDKIISMIEKLEKADLLSEKITQTL